jgi:hypothetical protein
MAKITQSLDDITGDVLPNGTPTTLVSISDPRNEYPPFEIDLSDYSVKALLKAVEKYRKAGREVAAPTTRSTSATDAEEAKAARAWAISTNLQPPVSERGAVPQRAIDAYREFLAADDGNAAPEKGE